MGCCKGCMKYTLFGVNLAFAVVGLIWVALGIAAHVRADFVQLGLARVPAASICLGLIIFTIAFLGCCGAIRENRCMLITYAIILIILMLSNLLVGIIIFVNIDLRKKQVPTVLQAMFKDDPAGFQKLESSWQCCGLTGPSSYKYLGRLPPSCCSSTPCTETNAFGGCQYSLSNFIDNLFPLIGVFAFIIAGSQLIAVVFALLLEKSVRKRTEVSETHES